MRFNAYIVILFMLAGCSRQAEPIEYGVDSCHYCQMRIMDPRFGAEVVTDKGRIYKFDSGECLLKYSKETQETVAQWLVTDYSRPRQLINATEATYLISKNMPSPMGAYLNAFSETMEARAYQEVEGGDLLNWAEVSARF